jgi:aspartyl-tRNA(Asn)/glutamyl-tRNA(Gln) amidotransferase subunit A
VSISRREFLHNTAAAALAAPLPKRKVAVPASEDDLAYMSITDLSQLLRQKKLSPVEVTKTILARIERLNPVLNAYITVTGDLALEQARRAEQEIAAGKWKGPLHGVPYSAKDLFATRGIRTTNGSKATAENITTEDAEVISRLKSAGAVLLGKTNLSEFASAAPGAFGEVVNPWSRKHLSGGSSSGSGAAVAAGLSFFSVGTDTGGSIRDPANACGIVGFKPTFALVSMAGVTPLSPTFDHVGFLTRFVNDVAPVLAAVSAVNARLRVGTFSRDLRGVRIAILEDDRDRPSEEFNRAFEQAAEVFRRRGAIVTSGLTLKHFASIPTLRLIPEAESAARYAGQLDGPMRLVGERFRSSLEQGAKRSAAEYIRAQWTRLEAMEEIDSVFRHRDLLLSVGSGGSARPITPRPPRPGAAPWRFAGFYANAVGIPTCQLPIGLSTEDGLPFGMWVYGARHNDATVIRAAAAYEAATDWHKRRPPLATISR